MREHILIGVCVICVCFCETSGNFNSSLVQNGDSGYTFLDPGPKDNHFFGELKNLQHLWKVVPLNIMENSTFVSHECSKAYNKFLKGLEKNDLNYTKMFDATAKLPSGILSGNVNQYGDFDECMELDNAQYCLAEIDIGHLWEKPYMEFKDLVHSYFVIKETFNDPKHRVPGFSMIRWGFCIPKECSNTDLERAIQEKLEARASVRPNMCQQNKPHTIPVGTYITLGIFAVIGLCVVISTSLYSAGYRIHSSDDTILNVIMCFSLQTNFEELISTHQKPSDIQSLHGIRALSALALIISHKVMALFYNPFINRTKMVEGLTYKWTVIGRTAILYTECFMVMSGLLNANSLFSDLDKSQTMKFKSKLINRLFRILPNLATVILFCTYILPFIGSGPIWPLVVNHHAELCKKHMWRNLIFIHNYFGFKDMCLTHTHQIGIDMQLFMVTPIFIYIIWYNKKVGLWLLGIISVLSTLLRFVVTWQHELSHVVHFGIPISRLFKTADLSYILPTHRATIYFIGVYLAYVLRYSSKKPFISNTLAIWGACYVFAISTWLGPVHTSRADFQYDPVFAALYAAFSPIFWGVSVAWIIYASNRGIGSWLGSLFTWKYFLPFTRIAYAVYLVQFPVFFYNIGKTKHVGEYKSYLMVDFVEMSTVVLLSILLTVVIEMPFQNIRKVLFEERSETRTSSAISVDSQKKTVATGELPLRKSNLG